MDYPDIFNSWFLATWDYTLLILAVFSAGILLLLVYRFIRARRERL